MTSTTNQLGCEEVQIDRKDEVRHRLQVIRPYGTREDGQNQSVECTLSCAHKLAVSSSVVVTCLDRSDRYR